jgi:hypothetical protein
LGVSAQIGRLCPNWASLYYVLYYFGELVLLRAAECKS